MWAEPESALELAASYFAELCKVASQHNSDDFGLLALRRLMERIYKDFTVDSNQSFANLFARTVYLHEKRQAPEKLISQINSLRRVCNQAAHSEMEKITEESLFSGVLALSNLITFLTQVACPQDLTELLLRYEAKEFPSIKTKEKHSFFAVVINWSIFDNRLELDLVNELGENCNLVLWDDPTAKNMARTWTRLAKSLWSYATVYAENLKLTSRGPGYYSSHKNTIIVLEPDFLVDATSIAECFQGDNAYPESFIINKLLCEATSEQMIQGVVINNVFDELIFHPDKDFDTMFEDSISMSPINLVSLGIEVKNRIKHNIQELHLPQLERFLKAHKSCDIVLEPSFICPRYGLQGRLDMLSGQNGKYEIVELKSGKAPNYDVWHNHRKQVIAYNMILKSVVGLQSLSSSSILYSSETENMLRNVLTFIDQEQELISCRNRIVGILHQLMDNPKPFMDWIKSGTNITESKILASKRNELSTILNRLKVYEYEWLLEQIRHIVLEIWCVKLGVADQSYPHRYGHNSLWQEDIEIKAENYRAIVDLALASIDRNTFTLIKSNINVVSDFREGDVVILYNQEKPVENQQLFRGVILQHENNKILVSIRGGVAGNPRLKTSNWVIEHDILDSLLYSPLSSVVDFLKADGKLKQSLLGICTVEDQVNKPYQPSFDNVIDQIRSNRSYCIIQGPPGTGKTSGLIARYIQEEYVQTTKKILILSFTNRAVDEICRNLLLKNVEFIRTGSSQSIENQLLRNRVKGLSDNEIDEQIKNNRIWLSTIQSANSWIRDYCKVSEFDEIIVDEASQIIEASVLGIAVNAPKLVLIGDQNQLPSITVQKPTPYSFSHELLIRLNYVDYGRSLMERLFSLCMERSWYAHINMLANHYRMHNDIALLINHYYQYKLQCGTQNQKNYSLRLTLNDIVIDKRVIWVNCEQSITYHYDKKQAVAISRLVQYILSDNSEYCDSDIGIVVPFRAQAQCIINELCCVYKNLSIDTVERFQGSERRIMIVSLPLMNKSDLSSIQSLTNDGLIDRKLNVAISRARDFLFVFGNASICSYSTHYRQLVQSISQIGKRIEVDCVINQ